MLELTRREVNHLEYDEPMPQTHDGKQKCFEDVFKSGGGQTSKEDAIHQVWKVEQEYPESSGWIIGKKGVFYDDIEHRWKVFMQVAKYQ